MKPKILLLGKNGKVGRELKRTLASLGEIIALDSSELDFTKTGILRENIRSLRPNLIVNAVAFTDIERAEQFPELAMVVNGEAPGLIAEEAFSLRIPLIHYSTNYIFDGKKNEPYFESDLANPVNAYGKSKLIGENAIQIINGDYMILRTCWVYSLYRESFVTHVLDWSRVSNRLRVITDQIGNPTWSRMLAETTSKAIAMGIRDINGWFQQNKGIYHIANKGNVSRFEWAKAILFFAEPNKKDLVVLPALTSDFPNLAPRPLYSALNCAKFYKTFIIDLPEWKYSLRLAIKDYFEH